MRIISERRLREFAERVPNARVSLTTWADVIEHSRWKSPAEPRRTFASADFVGELAVFNIGGNK